MVNGDYYLGCFVIYLLKVNDHRFSICNILLSKMGEKIDVTFTFQSHSIELLSDLYNKGSFSDVTLVTDDQTQFKCHKFVLSACSSVFNSLLNLDASSSLIYFRGVAREDMESVLQFMYLGEATFCQDRINDFLKVAKDINLKKIVQNDDNEELQDVSEEVVIIDSTSINGDKGIKVQNEIKKSIPTDPPLNKMPK